MNSRRVHELFLKHLPPIDFAQCDWTHLFPTGFLDETLLKRMLSALDEAHLIIHVQRKIGDVLPAEEGLVFIREHIGKGNIYVFVESFENWLVISQNGVAAIWPPLSNLS